MTFKQSYWVNVIGTLIGILLLFIAEAFQSSGLGVAGFIVMVASFVQTYVFHCCPACGRYVRPTLPEYRHCPHCGEEL